MSTISELETIIADINSVSKRKYQLYVANGYYQLTVLLNDSSSAFHVVSALMSIGDLKDTLYTICEYLECEAVLP